MIMNLAKKIRPLVFYPSFVGLLILALYSTYIGITGNIEAEKAYVTAMKTVSDSVMNNFGWFYALLALSLVLFVVWLAFSPYGRIRFGGKTAKPQIKYWNWFAMTLCGGIGTGIIFWAVAEPMMHFSAPPSIFGIAPFSPAAATFSLSQIFIEWTFTPYAIYTVCGIASGYTFFNLGKPRSISSTLEPALGSFVKGRGDRLSMRLFCLP